MVVALRLHGEEFTLDAALTCLLNFGEGELSKAYITASRELEPFEGICGHCLNLMDPKKRWCEGCYNTCLLYTSPSPRDVEESRMPSSA